MASGGSDLASGAFGGPDLASDWETHIYQTLLPLILDVHVHRHCTCTVICTTLKPLLCIHIYLHSESNIPISSFLH